MTIFNQYRTTGPSSAAAAGVREHSSQQFLSPWLDPASAELPSGMEEVFKFCELLWYSNGTYQQALQRIAAYFVTKIKIDDVDAEEKERWQEYLENDLHILKFMVDVGRNFLAYGNVLMSPRVTVSRTLTCDSCGQMAPIDQWDFVFRSGEFRTNRGGCPKCHKSTDLTRNDFRPLTPDSLDLRIWNPYTIKTKFNPITDRMIYRYILPRETANLIRTGDKDMLSDTPWEFVMCALAKKALKIHSDRIFHLKDTPLAGINSEGLGVPRAMANFRQAYMSQILSRLNMVLGLEYSTPLRSITPEGSGMGMMDPTMGINLGDVQNKLGGLLADWKRDPAAIHMFPIPLRYTAWGGEGIQLASHQVQEQVTNQLLTGLGIPVDFFVGTFKSERTFVPTLRLMERTWAELVSSYNAALDWIAETLSEMLRWKKPKLTMEPTTTADDVDLRSILLDLYMNGRISGRTAFDTLNLDPVKENRKMVEEQIEMQGDADVESMKQDAASKNTAAVNSAMQPQQQQPGAVAGQPATVPGQGAPQDAGSMANTPKRPDDVLAQAEQQAQQLLGMPQEQRRSALNQLRQSDQLLHDAVVQAIEKMRSQRGSDSGQAQQQQQQ